MFMELIDKIKLKETDTLYILGDVFDRGPHPIKVLMKLMEMPNAQLIVGNHELMALECLEFLMKEITDASIEECDEKVVDNILTWMINGSATTTDEFRQLDRNTQQKVIDYIMESDMYEEITVRGKDYLLVHAGLGNFSPDKEMEDYSLDELVWTRPDYDMQYFAHIYVITGHTPTQLIEDNPRPGFIYRRNNHIAIDCGAHIAGGRLAAICLDTGEEFYSSENVSL